jgi:hypothetical protein
VLGSTACLCTKTTLKQSQVVSRGGLQVLLNGRNDAKQSKAKSARPFVPGRAHHTCAGAACFDQRVSLLHVFVRYYICSQAEWKVDVRKSMKKHALLWVGTYVEGNYLDGHVHGYVLLDDNNNSLACFLALSNRRRRIITKKMVKN